MHVEFRTKKLQECFEESRKAQRAWGAVVATKYIQRVTIIRSAKAFDELTFISVLRCHPLTGNLAGFHSINLTGFYRLIVSVDEGVVTIEEVSKHYGD